MSSSETAVPAAIRRVRLALVPVGLPLAALLLIGLFGPKSPLTWLIAGPVFAIGVVTALGQLPLLVLWAVPGSMCVFYYLPIFHFEALVMLLALTMGFASFSALKVRSWRLQPVEARYLAFLATMLPGIVAAVSLWRYFGAFKVYFLGLLAFEVARHSVRRYGRTALLWGPAIFCAATAAMMAVRVVRSGIPAFKSVEQRVYLSDMGWGTSNYVAAVLVICVPSLVLLVRGTGRSTWPRFAAVGTLIATLGAILVTTSRGGALLAIAYLLSLVVRIRNKVTATALALLVVAGITLTPFGTGLVDRFTNPQGSDSIIFRAFIWQAGLQRGWTHLPFGVGIGQGILQNDRLQGIDTHNFLITLFAELGPIGVVAWLWLFAALVGAARRLSQHVETRIAGSAFKATLALAFANLLFEPTLVGNHYHLLFWWLVGILHGCGQPAELPPPHGRA